MVVADAGSDIVFADSSGVDLTAIRVRDCQARVVADMLIDDSL